MEKDADGFDPDQQGRDYQKIARSLPVFCVSSQVYKAKKGLSREKVNTEGFQELDDTEVPQLIAHAKRIAQTNRRKKQLRFLEACLQVFESLQYWLTITTTTAALTQEQSEVEIYHVQDCLERLKKVSPMLLCSVTHG